MDLLIEDDWSIDSVNRSTVRLLQVFEQEERVNAVSGQALGAVIRHLWRLHCVAPRESKYCPEEAKISRQSFVSDFPYREIAITLIVDWIA